MSAEATTKNFDCVAFQRQARARLGKEIGNLSGEELKAWMRDYRPSDHRLQRLMRDSGDASVQNSAKPLEMSDASS